MEKSSFFNSVAGDRIYQASDYADYFNSFVTNGVFPNPTTGLQVLANGGRTVVLKAGAAWINGYHYTNDADLVLTLDVADGLLKRRDRIMIKLDTILRKISAVVKKGVFATTPVAPTLQRDADAYELAVAEIYVGAGVVTILQANITDLRMNTTYCGWVNSLIQADTTGIFNQYMDWYTARQAEYNTDFTGWTTAKKAAHDAWVANSEAGLESDFTAWFNSMKDQLSTDAAGNIQLQLSALNTEIVKKATLLGLDYQIPSIVGSQVRLTKYADNRLYFQLSGALSTGSAITLSLDGGATSLPLQDVEGNAVMTLDKGFVEVVYGTSFFTYVPKKKVVVASRYDFTVVDTFELFTFYGFDPYKFLNVGV